MILARPVRLMILPTTVTPAADANPASQSALRASQKTPHSQPLRSMCEARLLCTCQACTRQEVSGIVMQEFERHDCEIFVPIREARKHSGAKIWA